MSARPCRPGDGHAVVRFEGIGVERCQALNGWSSFHAAFRRRRTSSTTPTSSACHNPPGEIRHHDRGRTGAGDLRGRPAARGHAAPPFTAPWCQRSICHDLDRRGSSRATRGRRHGREEPAPELPRHRPHLPDVPDPSARAAGRAADGLWSLEVRDIAPRRPTGTWSITPAGGMAWMRADVLAAAIGAAAAGDRDRASS